MGGFIPLFQIRRKNKMAMNISKIIIDKKGRITIPRSFMVANNIKPGTQVILQTVYNNDNCCKLEFINEEQ